MSEIVRLAIDFENQSESWWESGGRALWEGLLDGFDDNQVHLERALAESWLAEAAKIPGWHDGPEYAPHPVCVQAVEDDEQV